MTDKPDLSKPETILGFPIFGFGRVEMVSDENCEVRYRDRVIRTSEPYQRICFPTAPAAALAHHVSPEDVLFGGR
jgi:hypothetical protein